MAKSLKFKDTNAMQGSELYRHLEAGDVKKATEAYNAAEAVHRKSMGGEGLELLKRVHESLQAERDTRLARKQE